MCTCTSVYCRHVYSICYCANTSFVKKVCVCVYPSVLTFMHLHTHTYTHTYMYTIFMHTHTHRTLRVPLPLSRTPRTTPVLAQPSPWMSHRPARPTTPASPPRMCPSLSTLEGVSPGLRWRELKGSASYRPPLRIIGSEHHRYAGCACVCGWGG